MPLSDTSPEAEGMQLRVLKSLTGEQRLLLALEMSDFARELTKAGIREQHPDWSEGQVMWEIIRRSFFPDPLPAWLQKKMEEESDQMHRAK